VENLTITSGSEDATDPSLTSDGLLRIPVVPTLPPELLKGTYEDWEALGWVSEVHKALLL